MTGLRLLKDIISEEEEKELLSHIYEGEWLDIYARRVQHFGYLYEYRTRGLKRLYQEDDDTKGIPSWLTPECILSEMKPEQVIINEYKQGQGITEHTDAFCFGPKIMSLSLSLGADTVMTFTGGVSSIDVKLPRRSLLILEGPSRYKLKHAIKSHEGDIRISITYRTIAEGVTTSK